MRLLAIAILLVGCADEAGPSLGGLERAVAPGSLRPSSLDAAERASAEVAEVAAAGLRTWLDAIPASLRAEHGLRSADELALAVAGRPCPVLTLARQRPRELLATDLWRVPVLVRGEHRALLTVARIAGRAAVVEIGAARLAAQLGAIEQRLSPADTRRPRALLRLFALRADLLLLGARADGLPAIAWPLPSAERSLRVRSSAIDLEALHAIVEREHARRAGRP
jgi:hypothetical protein